MLVPHGVGTRILEHTRLGTCTTLRRPETSHAVRLYTPSLEAPDLSCMLALTGSMLSLTKGSFFPPRKPSTAGRPLAPTHITNTSAAGVPVACQEHK